MKQVYQVVKTGKLMLSDVPPPALGHGMVLVHVAASLVSAGTERSMLDFARKNIVSKALSRPDLVQQVLGKARREGVMTAIKAAAEKLDRPQPLGYSCAGTVIDVVPDVAGFHVGDRVACAGVGYANHAEIVAVPVNLVTRIPDAGVSFDEAAFTTVGAVAMHGLRLGKPQLGETVAVIGLGLIGIITVQLASAAGCQVVAVDPDAGRCDLARSLGCTSATSSESEFEALVSSATHSQGADAVIITAATPSNGPVELAGRIARSRAKVIAVGAVGTSLPRKLFFDKELEFVISRSYGPGRYDAEYEEKGHDYPVSYVRWTENRNLQAFLRLIADGKVNVQKLITHRVTIDDAERAYDLVSGESNESFLGILLTYPERENEQSSVVTVRPQVTAQKTGSFALGMLGSGNFAQSVLLPAFKRSGAFDLRGLCTANGATSRHAADKFGFQYCTTDEQQILSDPTIDVVAIATRHHLHARQLVGALRAGKHVFCEKPLCLNVDEVREIAQAYDATDQPPVLMVGFNRRFAPMSVQLRDFMREAREPLVIQVRVNGGYVPRSDWSQDSEVGGGRILGEVCHFVDLVQFVADSDVVRVSAVSAPDNGRYSCDNVLIMLTLGNGSIANITYVANGDKSSGKERVEVFAGGRSALLDDFRVLQLFHDSRRKIIRNRIRQDKGHVAECAAFAQALRSGKPPIPFSSVCTTTLATFAVQESLVDNSAITISAAEFLKSARATGTASTL